MPANPFQEGLQVQVRGDASDLENTIDGAMASVGKLRKSVGLLGGALAGLAAGALFKATQSAAEFESQMADVEKVTDAETAKVLEGRFMDLAETIPLPREELVKLGEQAGKFGAEGPDEIMKFVETVGQIQTATDMAAETAGQRFAKIAGAVGLPLSEVEKLGNGVNVLADSMRTDANEISDTANRTANILSQQLGLGEDAVLALSASMNEVSPSSRKAAGALTSMSEAMLDPKKVSDIAGALGMTSDEFRTMREENPQQLMEMIAKAMDEGGKKAAALRKAVGNRASRAFSKYGSQVEATEKAQKKVNDQFENGTSLSREMAIRTDTAAGQWQLFKNKVQNFATVTGQKLLPVAKKLLGWVNGLLDRLSALNEKTNGLIGVFAGLAVAIGGAATAVIAFLPQIASIASIVSGSVIPTLGTFAAILTGPVGLAIAGVVAAVAGLALAWKEDFMGIRDVTADVIGGLQEQLAAAGEAFGALVDTVRTAGELIVASLTGTWGLAETVTLMKLKQDVRAAVEDGIASIVETFDTLQQRIPPALARALNAAVAWLTSTGIPRLMQAFNKLATLAAQAFEVLATKLPPLIREAITTAVDWILSTGIPLAMDGWTALVDAALEILDTLAELLPPAIERGVTALVAWVQEKGIPLAKQAFGQFVGMVGDVLGLLEEKLPPLIGRAVQGIISFLREEGIPRAKAAFGFLIDAAVDILTTLQEKLPPLVDTAIRSALDWVKNNGPGLAKQAFQLVVDRALETLGFLAEKLPPLIEDGVRAMLTWVRENGPGLAKQAFKLLGKGIRKTLETFLTMGGILWGLFTDFIDIVVNYLKNDAVGDLKAAGEILLEGLKKGAEIAIEAVTPPDGIIVEMIDGIVHYLKNDAWDDLKAAAEFLFDVIMGAAEGLWEGLIGKSLFPEMIADIVEYLKNDALEDLKSAAKTFFEGMLEKAGELANSLFFNGDSIFKNLISELVSWLKNDAKGDLVSAAEHAAEAMANALKNKFNSLLPDSIEIPSVTIGGGSVSLPSTTIAGQKVGGVSLSIPSESIGGQSLSIPQLASGGFIEEGGLAMLHPGEQVVPAAEVDRPTKRVEQKRVDASLHIEEGAVHVNAPNADADAVGAEVEARIESFWRQKERRLR